jgi:hypothetical protein
MPRLTALLGLAIVAAASGCSEHAPIAAPFGDAGDAASDAAVDDSSDAANAGSDLLDVRGDVASGDVALSCAPPTEPNSVKVVAAAMSQPPWVEISVILVLEDPGFDFSRLANADDNTRASIIAERQAQLAPQQDTIEARLRSVGSRSIGRLWLADEVFAFVPAAHVSEIPCWPGVKAIDPDAVGCFPEAVVNGICLDPCLARATCDGACANLVGDAIDVARRCVRHGAPVACAQGAAGDDGPLTCYVRKDSGDVLAVYDPWLVETGHTQLRLCGRDEGGAAAPATLSDCP